MSHSLLKAFENVAEWLQFWFKFKLSLYWCWLTGLNALKSFWKNVTKMKYTQIKKTTVYCSCIIIIIIIFIIIIIICILFAKSWAKQFYIIGFSYSTGSIKTGFYL